MSLVEPPFTQGVSPGHRARQETPRCIKLGRLGIQGQGQRYWSDYRLVCPESPGEMRLELQYMSINSHIRLQGPVATLVGKTALPQARSL